MPAIIPSVPRYAIEGNPRFILLSLHQHCRQYLYLTSLHPFHTTSNIRKEILRKLSKKLQTKNSTTNYTWWEISFNFVAFLWPTLCIALITTNLPPSPLYTTPTIYIVDFFLLFWTLYSFWHIAHCVAELMMVFKTKRGCEGGIIEITIKATNPKGT